MSEIRSLRRVTSLAAAAAAACRPAARFDAARAFTSPTAKNAESQDQSPQYWCACCSQLAADMGDGMHTAVPMQSGGQAERSRCSRPAEVPLAPGAVGSHARWQAAGPSQRRFDHRRRS